jgi:GT2 family glycosyltransferase
MGPLVQEQGRIGPISAVVVNWNGERYLQDCLSALAALQPGLEEILLVDNGSTDGSLALVAERFPGVRVLSTGANLGPAAARNAGMRAARTRWVLALDNDVIVPPDLLTRLRAGSESFERVAIVQPRSVFRAEPSRVHYDGGSFHHAGLIALRNFYTPLAAAVGAAHEAVDVAVSLCLLVDREVLLAAGGYDESYFILFEDLDLSYRLRAAGWTIVSVAGALVLHDAGTAGISFREGKHYPARRVLFHSRNRWLYLLKCYPVRSLILLAPSLLLYEAVWLGFALLQGAGGAWLAGKREVWRRRGELGHARAVVQSSRTTSDRALLVGGPLTVTPALRAGRFSGALLALLDSSMRAWFALVRPLVG